MPTVMGPEGVRMHTVMGPEGVRMHTVMAPGGVRMAYCDRNVNWPVLTEFTPRQLIKKLRYPLVFDQMESRFFIFS